jgi:hypothetical protein
LNGNLVIDTSHDVNGTPGIQIGDPQEFLGESDECILKTVVVGNLTSGVSPRGAHALAIDSGRDSGNAGNPWVGMSNEQAFYQIDTDTGVIIQRVATPGISPFTAAIDSTGILWTRSGCCGAGDLASIDTAANPATPTVINTQPAFMVGGTGGYQLTIDRDNRIWLAGYPFGRVMRYDPAVPMWTEVAIPGGLTFSATGVVADGHGNVWTSLHSTPGGRVARIHADTSTPTGVFDTADSSGGAGEPPYGVAVDFAGDVWTANSATNNVSRVHIDPLTLEPAPHGTTGDTVDVFPVGAGPDTHSDFTGFVYRQITRPDGEYIVTVPACPDSRLTHWLTASWAATTPAGTRIELWFRTSNDSATLAESPLQGPWTTSSADLQTAPGPVTDAVASQLVFRLISEHPSATPTLANYSLTRTCVDP